MKLDHVAVSIWAALEAASRTPGNPLRTPTLATLGTDGTPQARMVVLRDVRPAARALVFHTDIRSAKWTELAAVLRASVLAWDPKSRQQMRLTGGITRHGPGSPEATAAWSTLPAHTRATYAGPAPGSALEATQATDAEAFGVLVFTAESLDWLVLERSGNLRARVDLTTGAAVWVAP
jgi:pyridoxine/pyridoxamine 5'-phosphate oxidase